MKILPRHPDGTLHGLRLARAVIGVTLLAGFAMLGWRNGDIFKQFDAGIFLLTTLAAIFAVAANTLMLRWITTPLASPLSTREAMLLSSLGSVGNSLGGLPIGTAAVIAILVKKHDFSLRDMVAGKLLSTGLATITTALLTAILSMSAPPALRSLLLALAFSGTVICFFLPAYLPHWIPGREIIHKLTQGKNLWEGMLYAMAISLTFMASSMIAITHYLPSLSATDSILLAGGSLLLNFLTLASGVGGMSEVIAGTVATALNMKFAAGVELGLLLRFSNLCAALLVLSCLLVWQRGWPSRNLRQYFGQKQGED